MSSSSDGYYSDEYYSSFRSDVLTIEDPSADAALLPPIGTYTPPDRQRTSVSLYWVEKVLLVLEYFQFSAVLWQTALTLLPATWAAGTPYTAVVLLDLWFFVQFDYYVWVGVVAALLLALYVGAGLYVRSLILANVEDILLQTAYVRTAVSWAGHCVYIPVAIATARLFACNEDGNLNVNLTVACWTPQHLVPTILLSFIPFLFLVGHLAHFVYSVYSQVIYTGKRKHDNFVRLKELMYLLSLDDAYATNHIGLFASLKRRWVYYWPLSVAMNALVTFLLVIVTRLDVSLFFVLLAVCIRMACFLITRPFRCVSTNVVLHILSWTNIMNTLLLWLVSTDITSPLLIASALSVWFIVFNFFALFAVCVWCLLVWCATPTDTAWPVTHTTIEDTAGLDFQYLLGVLREGQRILAYVEAAKGGLINPLMLREQASALQRALQIAADSRDPLEWALQVQLENISVVYGLKGPYEWDVITYEPLQAILPEFVSALRRRDDTLRLMSPTKRMLLLRMYCMSVFIGGRTFTGSPDDTYLDSVSSKSAASRPSSGVANSSTVVRRDYGYGTSGYGFDASDDGSSVDSLLEAANMLR